MAKGKKKTAEELLKAEKLNYEKLKEELSKSKQKIKELEDLLFFPISLQWLIY